MGTKQDEIREGIAGLLRLPDHKTFLDGASYRLVDEFLSYLHSQGVVIKVDRDMEFLDDIGIYPKSVVGGENDYEERSPYQNGWNEAVLEITKQWAKEAKDFKAVEPLIKEDKVKGVTLDLQNTQ